MKSNAIIAKFLANKYSEILHQYNQTVLHNNRTCPDLGGGTEEEMKATEEILNTTEETWNKMSKFFWEKDPAQKVTLKRAECV